MLLKQQLDPALMLEEQYDWIRKIVLKNVWYFDMPTKEDLIQDICIKFVEQFGKYDPERGGVSTWTYWFTRGQLSHLVKKEWDRKFSCDLECDIENDLSFVLDDGDPGGTFVDVQQKELRAVIDSVSARSERNIILKSFEGQTLRETASLVGCSHQYVHFVLQKFSGFLIRHVKQNRDAYPALFRCLENSPYMA